jgi:hypothetical protein
MSWRVPQPNIRNYSMKKAMDSWQMVEGRLSHKSLLPIDYWFEDCEALLLENLEPYIVKKNKGEIA